tara:strand:+ start:1429 stop:1794 length:366 start_codon:yes stop_codon:yes gene_type:complete
MRLRLKERWSEAKKVIKERKQPQLNELIAKAAITGALTFGIPGIYFSAFHQIERDKLMRKLPLVADTNNNGITTHEEWGQFFSARGIHYDIRNPPSLNDFSNKELRGMVKYRQNNVEGKVE